MSDDQLLQGLQKGDRKAFRSMFDRYYPYVMVSVTKICGDRNLAKDVAQEVFFEVWKKREIIQVKGALKSYLRRAGVNRMLNQLKARKLQYEDPVDLPEPPQQNHSAQQHLEAEDMRKVIQTAIDSLPERCRLVFTLKRIEGLSQKEIAEKMGISTKTVENQMVRALKVLRVAAAPYVANDKMLNLLFFFWSIFSLT